MIIIKVLFNGLVNIGTRLEFLFLGLIVMVAISTALVNYNFLRTIQVDDDIAQQSDQIIKNSDRNYHATINATAALFTKENQRGNQTVVLFTNLINQIKNNTDDIKNESHAIHNTHLQLMDNVKKQLNQSATSVQGERNYKALQQILTLLLNNKTK